MEARGLRFYQVRFFLRESVNENVVKSTVHTSIYVHHTKETRLRTVVSLPPPPLGKRNLCVICTIQYAISVVSKRIHLIIKFFLSQSF